MMVEFANKSVNKLIDKSINKSGNELIATNRRMNW